MPDVDPHAALATIETFAALDVHKRSIVAAVLAAEGGEVQLHESPTPRGRCGG